MLLAELCATSAAVAATSSRRTKIEALAACLRRAATAPDEIPIAVSYLSGELRQRRTGVGWAALRDLPPAAGVATLGLAEVDRVFAAAENVAGAGSVAARRALLADLFGRATAEEQAFLVMLAGGELRQGALGGIMADAVAWAAGIDTPAIRRAAMFAGDLAAVAATALVDGAAALERFRLEVGRPLQPMLAQSAPSIEAAMDRLSPDPAPLGAAAVAVDFKFDGIRIQVHRDGADVAVFSRTLDVITGRVPEIVESALALPARRFVLDGEAIALGPDRRPRPFQETAGRAATRVGSAREARRLTPFYFDVLHLDGDDFIDRRGADRVAALDALVPRHSRVPRAIVQDADSAAAFFAEALGAGHEGVVLKTLGSPYEAGRRGTGWVKVKPRHTLDLVVLAAEWGHGRRTGWLSNLHLGARDPESGTFVMLGKTFKGMTDALLEWQTAELLARERERTGAVVHVRPELVVEVAFDGIQRSSRYPGGMTLRFARVVRYRMDKGAADADTVESVRRLRV